MNDCQAHDLVTRKNYEYRPLDPNRREIRIIKLLPAADISSPIRCKIVHIFLHSRPRPNYTAISYVWGTSREEGSMQCTHDDDEDDNKDDNDEDEVVKVMANCILALKRARHDKIRYVWIDAVCINQTNEEERGHQVEIMGDIYRDASNVLIMPSLAPQTRMEQALIHIVECDRYQQIWELPISVLWETVTSFIQRTPHYMEWFQRTWVLQESVLAKNAVLALGETSVPFREFIDASRRYARHFRTIINVHESLILHQKLLSSPSMTLLQLLCVTRFTKATEARDKIFALLGIASDGAEYKPLVNYNNTISTADIFTRCTRQIICRSGRLDILGAVYGHEKTAEGMPSWTPDWRSFNPNFRMIVDPSRPTLPKEQLGCGSVSVRTFTSVDNLKTLRLRGTALCNIIRKKIVENSGFLRMRDGRDFRRTVLSSASNEYAAKLLMDIFTCGYVEQPTETLTAEQKECVDESRTQMAALAHGDYRHFPCLWKIKYGYLHQRSLIETSDGHFGLAPVTVIKGDLICVLEGGSVPYVLRRKRCDAEEYQLIGECYVSRVTCREAMNGLEEEDCKTLKTFDIGCAEESWEDERVDFEP